MANIPVGDPPHRSGVAGRAQAAACPLEALYLSERDGLLRYLLPRVGEDQASDIVHDVFARAAASGQLLQLINPGGFLCRIAQNLLIDRARRRRSRVEPLALAEAFDMPVLPEQEHDLEADDLHRTILQALTALPEKTRRVFVMHRFEERAYRDIHLELGISLATVEYHMGRALAHVRGAVADAALIGPEPSPKNNFIRN